MKSLDYIIPLVNIGGEDFEDRVVNINFILDKFLSIQTNIKITVYIIEQIINTDFKQFKDFIIIPNNLSVKLISVNYPIFCKPWLYNIGIKNSTSENIILADGDVWSNKDYFNDLIYFAEVNNLKWCFGWYNAVEITIENKNKLINNGIVNYKDGRYLRPLTNGYEGYAVFFKRDFLSMELGGLNELFRELGANDNEIASRAKHASGTYKRYPITIIHLWHKKSSMKFSGSWNFNQQLFQFTKSNNNYIKVNNFLKLHILGDLAPLDIELKKELLENL